MRSPLADFLYDKRAPDREQVTVLDVGCSGGLGTEWDVFGSSLRAFGFDPLEFEIERLRRVEHRPSVSYEAAFVGLSAVQESARERDESALSERHRFDPDPMSRSSAIKAAGILSYDHQKEIFNAGADKIYTSRRISLDEFAEQHSLKNVDFLKVDTDGHDVEVLFGAQKLLGSTVLGAKIECFFHGPVSPYTNVFSNVDRIMTDNGLQLFEIQPRTLTRAALPGPFAMELLGRTINGSAVWADVLYLRDLAHPSYESSFGFEATPERVIKSACLMEAWGLQDCAAELIVNRSDRLPYPSGDMLDLLVPNSFGPNLSYSQYLERFAANPRDLLPSRAASVTPTLPFVAGVRRELPLDRAVSHWNAGLSSSGEGKLLVTTADQAWAYAAVLPLPDYRGTGALVIEMDVVEGQIGISVANADYTELASEVLVDAASNRHAVILPLSGSAIGGALMIRNGSRAARSRVCLSSAAFFAN